MKKSENNSKINNFLKIPCISSNKIEILKKNYQNLKDNLYKFTETHEKSNKKVFPIENNKDSTNNSKNISTSKHPTVKLNLINTNLSNIQPMKKQIPFKSRDNELSSKLRLNIDKVKNRIKSRTSLNSENVSLNNSNCLQNKSASKLNTTSVRATQDTNHNNIETDGKTNDLKNEINGLKNVINYKSSKNSQNIFKEYKEKNSFSVYNSNLGSRILTLNSDFEEEKNEINLENTNVEVVLKTADINVKPNEEINNTKEFISVIEILKNYILILHHNLELKTKELNVKIKSLKDENSKLKNENNEFCHKLKQSSKYILNIFHQTAVYEENMKDIDNQLQIFLIQLLEENSYLRNICEKEISNKNVITSNLQDENKYTKNKFLNDSTINFGKNKIELDDTNKIDDKNDETHSKCSHLINEKSFKDSFNENRMLKKLSLYKSSPKLYLYKSRCSIIKS